MMDLSAYNQQMFNPYKRTTGSPTGGNPGGTAPYNISGGAPGVYQTGGPGGMTPVPQGGMGGGYNPWGGVGGGGADVYQTGTPSGTTLIPVTQTTGGGGGWTPPSDWGAYNVWGAGNDPNEFAWGGESPQSWWRSPDMAGGVVYNDQYGWQLADPVRDWYRQFQTAPTAEQFGAAGWTPQGVGATDVGGWREYYPDRDTDAGWAARGYGWNQEAGEWQQGYNPQSGGAGDLMQWTPSGGVGGMNPYLVGTDPNASPKTGSFSDYYPQGTSPTGGPGGGADYSQNEGTYYGDTTGAGSNTRFPFSPDLYQASNVLGNFSATGGETQAPPEWALSGDIAARMGMTGMPVDQSASYQAQKAVAQQNIQDEIDQAAERANLTGLRWSTPLGQSAQNIAGKYMGQLGAATTAQEAAAQEAARQRQLTGASQLYGVGQGYAGLQENAAGRALQAAGMLPETAAMYTNLPMSVAQSAYNMGTGNQNLANQQIQAYYAEMQRMMEENNPWLKYAAGVTQLPFQAAQTTYQPSFLSQILGAAGNIF